MSFFNRCLRNHPVPLFCPLSVRRGTNDVVNPVIMASFGSFANADVGEVGSGSIIPVLVTGGRGLGISASTSVPGAISLLPGTYAVSYRAEGVVPAGGVFSIALRLNGQIVDHSVLTVSQVPGTLAPLGTTIVVEASSTGTLELINSSPESADVLNATVFIRDL